MIPDTQRQAYRDIKPELPEKRAAVLDVIDRSMETGCTLFEICEAIHWPINSVSGRVTELAKAGWVKDSGKTRVHRFSGKACIVWIGSTPAPDGQMNLL